MRSKLVWGTALLVACSSEVADEDAGSISLAVASAPPGAACLRVNVDGASTTAERSLKLTPGAPTKGTLSGLPLGSVSVRAAAFSGSCSSLTDASVPTWVSEPVSAVLRPGTPVDVQLVMQKAGQISVSVDWSSGGASGGGAGGTSSGGAAGAAGSGGSLLDVAQALNGQMFLASCLLDVAASVCQTRASACPPALPNDPALSGALLTDKNVILGGTVGTPYTVTLHVQGVVEAKRYTGSLDQSNVGASPMADGFAIGGAPSAGDAYGVYLLRVTNPGSAQSDYFLNSLVPPGVSDHTTYGVDYLAKIKAQGGATIRLVAADANCTMIKNCGPQENAGNVCAGPIVLSSVDPVAVAKNPGFNFSAPYNGQWLSLVVKDVTSP